MKIFVFGVEVAAFLVAQNHGQSVLAGDQPRNIPLEVDHLAGTGLLRGKAMNHRTFFISHLAIKFAIFGYVTNFHPKPERVGRAGVIHTKRQVQLKRSRVARLLRW